MQKPLPIRIGCAGWSVPKAYAAEFATSGSHLERYAGRFNCVEINSSFYRPHQPQTYAKWAASVPEAFRFAVKVPKSITHEKRLREADEPLERFLGEAGELGPKLGPLLVQLPPSLAFHAGVAGEFCALLRERFSGEVVWEPRHESWFSPEGEALLQQHHIARVAADPAPVRTADLPGGWDGLVYYRLHGSPRIYYSDYSPEYLDQLIVTLQQSAARGIPTWCIFDNTAEFAATGNALHVQAHLAPL